MMEKGILHKNNTLLHISLVHKRFRIKLIFSVLLIAMIVHHKGCSVWFVIDKFNKTH